MDLTTAMTIKTVAMCVQTVVMAGALIFFVIWMRRMRYNSPLEVKRREYLAKMARYDEEDRLRDLELQKLKDNPHAD